MNKYIEAMERLMQEGGPMSYVTTLIFALFGMAAVLVSVIVTVKTYGLTLLATLLWWGYIVYKEANKDE